MVARKSALPRTRLLLGSSVGDLCGQGSQQARARTKFRVTAAPGMTWHVMSWLAGPGPASCLVVELNLVSLWECGV